MQPRTLVSSQSGYTLGWCCVDYNTMHPKLLKANNMQAVEDGWMDFQEFP